MNTTLFTISFKKFGIIVGMVLLAALSRVLPHPPNFAPMTALALFSGAYCMSAFSSRTMSRIATFLLPLIAMLVSDTVLEFTTGWGFHSGMPIIYGTIAFIAIIGMWLQHRLSVGNIALATFSGSVIFFVVTNFFVWFGGAMYPQTGAGLIACYTAALPFFGNSLMGDATYSIILFGGFAFAERYILTPQRIAQ